MTDPLRIPLSSVPREGQTLSFEERELWMNGIREFDIPCTLPGSITVLIHITPLEKGLLVRGTLSGTIEIPCTRCAEPTAHTLHHDFESFECMPADPMLRQGGYPQTKEDDENVNEPWSEDIDTRIREENGSFFLDLGALLWEEFVLAQPLHPLCADDCKGLCPRCGHNLNLGPCQCKDETDDPRMEIFKTLTVSSKKS
ncbi:MAG: DUF177 domain-containing protein [Desulfovibrio sp.]|nr:DUF177 domain-containing protein [Desulfovibrio sp.]